MTNCQRFVARKFDGRKYWLLRVEMIEFNYRADFHGRYVYSKNAKNRASMLSRGTACGPAAGLSNAVCMAFMA